MLKVFGIRHHGPGSAKRLKLALNEMEPEVILIEGPPEGNAIIHLADHPDMTPPIALLIYQPTDLNRASYYPFATFSPEWQAILYAKSQDIPVRFIDLSLAYRWREYAEKPTAQSGGGDLLGEIARAAGFSSGVQWWEEMIEKRSEQEDLFTVISELIGEVRSMTSFQQNIDQETLRREAFMRKEIRKAQKEGFQKIAVVCGAFHAPVLQNHPPQKQDNAILRGMKKVKTAATWIPWTYQRLSYASGYGAGIYSPEWYDLIFHFDREKVVEYWMAKTAHLFRDEGLDASPANVIEAVRFVYALTNLRGLSVPGLQELYDAAQTVFCFGQEEPLRLVEEKLIIGERMGQVPAEAPTLPLQANIKKLQKTLRLKVSNKPEKIALDLRKDLHLRKSQFLHRLNLLDINWGEIQKVGRFKKGTFHENWEICWRPELEIQIVEAANWGNTVEQACVSKVKGQNLSNLSLSELTVVLEKTFLADLEELIPILTKTLSDQVALSVDMLRFMEILPSLINIFRYGNVRQIDGELVLKVIDDIFPRLLIGFPGACVHIEDEFAETIFQHLVKVNGVIQLMGQSYIDEWQKMLAKISEQEAIHAKIKGITTRILFDNQTIDLLYASRLMGLALSAAVLPGQAAGWIEGFLNGSGLLLIHNPALWKMIDQWIATLTEDHFVEMLPLLRRTFSQFSPAERRQMGEMAQKGPEAFRKKEALNLNEENIRLVLPVIKNILGK